MSTERAAAQAACCTPLTGTGHLCQTGFLSPAKHVWGQALLTMELQHHRSLIPFPCNPEGHVRNRWLRNLPGFLTNRITFFREWEGEYPKPLRTWMRLGR